MAYERQEILRIENITKNFGGLFALSDLSLHVDEGEMLVVIGPNGAGKTTLFGVICGVYPPMRGSILFNGKDLVGLKTHEIAAKGVVRTFQANSLFKSETVLDNVIFGFHLQRKTGSFGWVVNNKRTREQEGQIQQEAERILDYTGLSEERGELAGNLAHGKQRVLGVAVALAANPRLLLLDEPLTGMNTAEKTDIVAILKGLKQRGLTLILIEHDMMAVMNLGERIVVLNYGRKIAEGMPHEVQSNKEVMKAYLGEEEEEEIK